MNRIVVDFQLGSMDQKVYTYSDEGTILEKAYCTTDGVVDTIKAMKTKFGVNQIDLIGNVDYLKKFKNELKNTNYEFDHIAVNIIGRRI